MNKLFNINTLILTTFISSLSCLNPVHSATIVTVIEDNDDVIFSVNGSLNLTDLTLIAVNQSNTNGFIAPSAGDLGFAGGETPALGDVYTGSFSSKLPYGSGLFSVPDLRTGDRFQYLNNRITVPRNYKSGENLQSSMTFSEATFISLGLIEGTYVTTWGTGANRDSFTIQIGESASVPEPLNILGTATALGFGALFRKKKGWSQNS